MSNSTKKERLLYRKGFNFDFKIDYLIRFLGAFFLFSVLINNGVFQINPINVLSNAILFSSMAGILYIFIENIVLNTTLYKYENSKVFKFLNTYFSSLIAILIGGIIKETFNTLDASVSLFILFIVPAIFASIHVSVSLFFFDIAIFVSLLGIHTIGHYSNYGLTFIGGFSNIIMITFITYLILSLTTKVYTNFITKRFLNSFKVKYLFSMFFIHIINLLTYLFVLWVFKQLDLIHIISYTQIIILYVSMIIYQTNINFNLSRISTKTETTSYSYF